jgi:hypothetical protein
MSENWKPVSGYEGVYEVSDYGRIKRLKKAQGATSGGILKPALLPDGRLKVVLCVESIGRNFKVHILVSRAFLGIPASGLEVNHKDGNPANNYLSNLEYVTPKENSIHARRVLLRGAGESHYKSKLTADIVKQIRQRIEPHPTLARDYGVSISTIQDVRAGRTWGTVQ